MCAAREDRKHGKFALERRCDFGADDVVRVVDAAFAAGARIQPVRADDDNAGGARPENRVDRLFPIGTGSQGGDVPEDSVRIAGIQPVVKPSRVGAAVGTPIADEDLSSRLRHNDSRAETSTLSGSSTDASPRPINRA
jgi:hypothetical protein